MVWAQVFFSGSKGCVVAIPSARVDMTLFQKKKVIGSIEKYKFIVPFRLKNECMISNLLKQLLFYVKYA